MKDEGNCKTWEWRLASAVGPTLHIRSASCSQFHSVPRHPKKFQEGFYRALNRMVSVATPGECNF